MMRAAAGIVNEMEFRMLRSGKRISPPPTVSAMKRFSVCVDDASSQAKSLQRVKQHGRHKPAISRRAARVLDQFGPLLSRRGRREDRVLVAPAVRVQKKARGRTTGGGPNNRPSLRNGLNGLYVLSLGTGFLPPSSADHLPRIWHQHRDARTTRFRRRIELFVHVKITLQTDAPTASEAQRS